MAALQWDPSKNDSLPPTLTPAVPPYVTLGLTAVYTVFYLLLFLFVYVQLWLVLHHKHKRFSYQTVFLFLCLLWASLRAVLFSFYFRNFVAANSLGPFAFWLLYCCPVCLQFFTLTLMNLYFTQVIFKAKSKYSPELLKYRLPLYLVFLFVSLVFLVVNFTCAILVRLDPSQTKVIVSVRVAINDTLFVLCAISLSICLYKISKMSLANIYLESKGSSLCQVTAIGVTVILLYTSRACYNLVILSMSQEARIHSFDYDWYNVSDQADLKCKLGDAGYIVFGIILFVWELLPTSSVVYFFRVRNPVRDLTNTGMIPSHGFGHRSYFFDNPRRYDSDDDLSWNIAPQSIQGSFVPECNNGGTQANSFTAYIGSVQEDSALLPYAPTPI
ncbi:integral membrane protein GPR137B isoform X2 [Rhinatrema bivittatum]|uniref:integral membrane protein GPR137B isoform X2 n=1 Tax=Rhinatrema bivittatum TaxID=194408 RepID=UPI001127DC6C|nr:integral membrane protein GPR137B isoform X2 [Rhinatrema bivittatum]